MMAVVLLTVIRFGYYLEHDHNGDGGASKHGWSCDGADDHVDDSAL